MITLKGPSSEKRTESDASKNSLFRKSNKMSKWVSFFREYHATKQNNVEHVQKLPNTAARQECARFGFRRFLDNLEKSTSKHTPHIGDIIDKIGCNGART